MQMLDKYANHSPERGADSHRRHKYPSGDLTPVGDYDQEHPQACGYQQRKHNMPACVTASEVSACDLLQPTVYLLANFIVIVGPFTLAEENLHALCHVNAEKHVGITQYSGKSR